MTVYSTLHPSERLDTVALVHRKSDCGADGSPRMGTKHALVHRECADRDGSAFERIVLLADDEAVLLIADALAGEPRTKACAICERPLEFFRPGAG